MASQQSDSSNSNSKNDLDSQTIEQLQRLLNLDSRDRSQSMRLLQQLLTPAVCRRLGIYSTPESFLLSVIVPIFNEVKTVQKIVETIREVPIPTEVILVDDGRIQRPYDQGKNHGKLRLSIRHKHARPHHCHHVVSSFSFSVLQGDVVRQHQQLS